jgi:hypothetical protein
MQTQAYNHIFRPKHFQEGTMTRQPYTLNITTPFLDLDEFEPIFFYLSCQTPWMVSSYE